MSESGLKLFSALYGINVSDNIKREILNKWKAVWCKKIKYVGIMMVNMVVIKDWLDSNLTPIINQLTNLKNGKN